MSELDTAVITRRIEIDAGHRVPHHESKCRHLHGHRYRFTAAVRGPVQAAEGQSEGGMVTDFGVLKHLLTVHVHDQWDHRVLIYQGDPILQSLGPGDWGLVVLPFIPTAENLARHVGLRMTHALANENSDLLLEWVECRETPNCTARWPAYESESHLAWVGES